MLSVKQKARTEEENNGEPGKSEHAQQLGSWSEVVIHNLQ